MDAVAGWRVYKCLYDKSPTGVPDPWFMTVTERMVANKLTAALRSAVRLVTVTSVLMLALLKQSVIRADANHKCRLCRWFRIGKEKQG